MKRKATSRQTLAIFWRFTQPYKRFFWLSTISAGIAVVIQDVIPPFIIAKAFDLLQHQLSQSGTLDLDAFWPYILAFIGFMVGAIFIWRIQVWFAWKFEVNSIRDLAVHIFDHLQRLGVTFHANRFSGALVSQTNKMLTAYEKIGDEFTWSITTTAVLFVTALSVLLFTSPVYAVFFAVASIFFLSFALYRTKITMAYDRALASSESERTAKLADTITNVSAVGAFAGEQYEYKLFEKQADETRAKYWALLRKVMVNDTSSHIIVNSLDVVAFVAGVAAITVLHQPAGALFLAVNYTMQLTHRLWESRRTMRNLNRSLGDASDMTEILQLEPDVQDAPNAKQLKVKKGYIELVEIDFAYPEQADQILFEKLSMKVRAGEKVGLVGHSGSGKTSFTKIMLRFMDLQGGQILIDGQDIAKVTQTSLRQNIAYVPQEPMLFHRSIADNIRYGNPSASDADVVKFAKMAHAHEFVKDLPNGYGTLVGERGVKLSGGQRQRVAIARAMLKDAPILLLDEATSALDSESELLIQDALWKLMERRTAIVIAHRLSTIQKMDRIIVMEDGKIVEEGSHKELLEKDGVYASLWKHQSGGFIEE